MDQTEIQDMIRNGRSDELANLIRIQGERIQQLQREKELLEEARRPSTQKLAKKTVSILLSRPPSQASQIAFFLAIPSF
jgi:hypothetical protein